jgi:hypothetical protein
MRKYKELKCPLHGDVMSQVSVEEYQNYTTVVSCCPEGCRVEISTSYDIADDVPSADAILKDGVLDELTGKFILPDCIAGLTIENKQVSGIQYENKAVVSYTDQFHSIRKEKK